MDTETEQTCLEAPQPGTPSTPRPAVSRFGAPILFDLTVLRERTADRQLGPTIYYLSRPPVSEKEVFPWRTVIGFGAVVLSGVSLGLVLACLLLP